MRSCLVLFLGCMGCMLLAPACAARRTEGVTLEPASYLLSPGGHFTIELPSNPSTGYQWQLGLPLDERVLQLVESRYEPLEVGKVGAGGATRWTFAGVAPGRTTIELIYVRPWERGVAAARRATYSVEVTARPSSAGPNRRAKRAPGEEASRGSAA